MEGLRQGCLEADEKEALQAFLVLSFQDARKPSSKSFIVCVPRFIMKKGNSARTKDGFRGQLLSNAFPRGFFDGPSNDVRMPVVLGQGSRFGLKPATGNVPGEQVRPPVQLCAPSLGDSIDNLLTNAPKLLFGQSIMPGHRKMQVGRRDEGVRTNRPILPEPVASGDEASQPLRIRDRWAWGRATQERSKREMISRIRSGISPKNGSSPWTLLAPSKAE